MESHLDNPIGQENTSQPAWLAGAVADAYKLPGVKELGDAADSVGNFAKDHWKEITGVGVAVVAGTAFVVGRRYGLLSNLLKGGEVAGLKSGVSAADDVVARLKGVKDFVYDMDRTLVDHDGALKVMQRTMTDGLTKSSGLPREFISDALEQTTKRLDSPYFFKRLDEIKPLQAHFPGVNLNQRFADVAASSKQAYDDALKAKPEIVELLDLQRSQGKGIHVFTAGTPTRALEKLQGAGLLNKVDTIFTSGVNAFEDSGAARLMIKTDSPVKLVAMPESAKATGSGYEYIAEHLKTRASKMVMTGDHPVEDVANAKAHGYITAMANWYRQSKQVTAPDLDLATPAQFTTLLKTRVFNS